MCFVGFVGFCCVLVQQQLPDHRFTARTTAEDLIHRVDLLVENFGSMSQAFRLHEMTQVLACHV